MRIRLLIFLSIFFVQAHAYADDSLEDLVEFLEKVKASDVFNQPLQLKYKVDFSIRVPGATEDFQLVRKMNVERISNGNKFHVVAEYTFDSGKNLSTSNLWTTAYDGSKVMQYNDFGEDIKWGQIRSSASPKIVADIIMPRSGNWNGSIILDDDKPYYDLFLDNIDSVILDSIEIEGKKFIQITANLSSGDYQVRISPDMNYSLIHYSVTKNQNHAFNMIDKKGAPEIVSECNIVYTQSNGHFFPEEAVLINTFTMATDETDSTQKSDFKYNILFENVVILPSSETPDEKFSIKFAHQTMVHDHLAGSEESPLSYMIGSDTTRHFPEALESVEINMIDKMYEKSNQQISGTVSTIEAASTSPISAQQIDDTIPYSENINDQSPSPPRDTIPIKAIFFLVIVISGFYMGYLIRRKNAKG